MTKAAQSVSAQLLIIILQDAKDINLLDFSRRWPGMPGSRKRRSMDWGA